MVDEAHEKPVTELPPLSSAIDLDALAKIVTPESSNDVTVTFTYADLSVYIHSGTTVYVRPLRDEGGNLPSIGG